jgi:hypothetical protein
MVAINNHSSLPRPRWAQHLIRVKLHHRAWHWLALDIGSRTGGLEVRQAVLVSVGFDAEFICAATGGATCVSVSQTKLGMR